MPAVARQGDSVLSPNGFGHKCRFPGETSVTEVNSSRVYANGKLIVVIGNRVGAHPLPGCSAVDMATLSSASSTVKIGGRGVGRIGDQYNDNTISEGSQNVFVWG